MKTTTKSYGVKELVALLVKLMAPAIDAWKAETAPRKKAAPMAETPVVVAPVIETPVVAEVAKTLPAPIPLTVIPSPIMLTLGVIARPTATKAAPKKAASRARKATKTRTMPSAARTTTKKIEAPDTLYRKAKRGDRYEIATAPTEGEQLFRRVPSGKRFRYEAA